MRLPRTLLEALAVCGLALLPAGVSLGWNGLPQRPEAEVVELADDEVTVERARAWGDAVLWVERGRRSV